MLPSVRLIVNQDNDVATKDVLDNMDYDFISQSVDADIIGMDIIDYNITDSK